VRRAAGGEGHIPTGSAGGLAPCDDARTMTASTASLAEPVLAWYAEAARDLPWRRPEAGPWAVLVSEIMLQQTPVRRVLPAYTAWLERWPVPAALAADSPGEAVRMWAKLGYPRRALRLHECAAAIVRQHAGEVPSGLADLLALPGVGEYTARAVACFAFGQRHPVVDTNVRRVVHRAVRGSDDFGAAVGPADRAAVEALLPGDRAAAARFSAALMELGALVCTARTPDCRACPVLDLCNWQRAGRPAGPTARRPTQRYAGTDRQARGRLLDVLRAAPGPVQHAALAATWPDADRRERALDSLVSDGLVDPLPDGRYALPGSG
jgi:A/G-specific adenine glycosylase